MVISSMSALQLHLLLIHNLLIPQVRPRHVHKRMYRYVTDTERLASTYFNGRKHVTLTHAVM